jgi:hypothetical protein
LIFEYPNIDIKTSHKIKFQDNTVLKLRGIVYHGDSHFTSRIISPEGNIWFHDGMTTGGTCETDGHLETTKDKQLRNCQSKKLVLVVYA